MFETIKQKARQSWEWIKKQTKKAIMTIIGLIIGTGILAFSIQVITVHSHPQQGDLWKVTFRTIGIAPLKIIPDDQNSIDDLEFVSLKCNGEEKTPQILAGDVISEPIWFCRGEAEITHLVKIARKHYLKFQFGNKTAMAYNSPGTLQYILGGTSDDPATSTKQYTTLMGDGNTTWANVIRASIVSTPGNLSNLQVSVKTAPGAGQTWYYTVTVGGATAQPTTTLAVTISGTATSSSLDSDLVAIAAGQKVSLQASSTGSSAMSGAVYWSVQFTPTTDGETLLMSNSAGANITSNRYLPLIGARPTTATRFDGETLFPTAGTLKNFYVELYNAPGAGISRTFTIFQNAASTTLVVIISGTATGSQNLADTLSISAGDSITIFNSTSTGTPAASAAMFGATFIPTTQGEWFVSCNVDIINNLFIRYAHLNCGASTAVTAENEFYTFAQGTTVKAIYFNLSVDPGTAPDAYRASLRQNNATTSLTTIVTADNTTGNATTNIVIALGDYLDTVIEPVNTPSATPFFKVAYLFYNAPTGGGAAITPTPQVIIIE